MNIAKAYDAAKGLTTTIYPREMKPTRVGVYARDYGPNWGWQFCFWDGEYWCYAALSVRSAKAKRNRNLVSPYQDKKWMGVLK